MNYVVWGMEKTKRVFLYNDDMAEACLFLLEQPESNLQSLPNDKTPPLINVGFGKEISIKELADLVKDIVDFTGDLAFDTSKQDGTMRKLMGENKLKQMGWQATTKLRDGITGAYKSYLEGRA